MRLMCSNCGSTLEFLLQDNGEDITVIQCSCAQPDCDQCQESGRADCDNCEQCNDCSRGDCDNCDARSEGKEEGAQNALKNIKKVIKEEIDWASLIMDEIQDNL